MCRKAGFLRLLAVLAVAIVQAGAAAALDYGYKPIPPETAYGAQNIPTGELPGNLRQAMDLVKGSNLPVHLDAAVLHTLEGRLERLGFSDIGDFSHKLSSQFEGLKWAH